MQLHNLAERKKIPSYKVYNLCAERNLYAPSRVSKCGHLELCPCTPEVTPRKRSVALTFNLARALS